MMVVMGTFFGVLNNEILRAQLQVIPATGQPPNFMVYVLTGQLVFSCFSDGTNMAMDSVLNNAPLIKKVYIPKYIFPLEKVVFSLINTLFSMLALVLMMLVTQSYASFWALLAPVALGLLFLFNLGVGLILSAGVIFFRDIKHFYSILVLALTYMTPIFYSVAIFGGNTVLLTLVRLNPLYWFVGLFRQVVLYGEAPTGFQLGVPCLCAAVALLLGLLIFRKTQDDFILYI